MKKLVLLLILLFFYTNINSTLIKGFRHVHRWSLAYGLNYIPNNIGHSAIFSLEREYYSCIPQSHYRSFNFEYQNISKSHSVIIDFRSNIPDCSVTFPIFGIGLQTMYNTKDKPLDFFVKPTVSKRIRSGRRSRINFYIEYGFAIRLIDSFGEQNIHNLKFVIKYSKSYKTTPDFPNYR